MCECVCVDQGLGFMMLYLPNSLYILYAYINIYMHIYGNPFMIGNHTHTHVYGLAKNKEDFCTQFCT